MTAIFRAMATLAFFHSDPLGESHPQALRDDHLFVRVAGHASRISELEIEECIHIGAVALCWHLAALGHPTRRDPFMEGFRNETFGLVVGVEAAGVARKKGITVGEAIKEIAERDEWRTTVSSNSWPAREKLIAIDVCFG